MPRRPVRPLRPALLRLALVVAGLPLAAGCGLGPSEPSAGVGLRGVIEQDAFLSQFAQAIGRAQIAGDLDAEGVTVFAPTDVAFRYLGAEALRRLENEPALFATVLRRHVVRGRVGPEALTDGAELPTVAGPPLVVRRDGDRVTVGGLVVDPDPLDAGNGLLYEVAGLYTDHLDAETRLRLIPQADRFRDLLQRAGVLDRLRGPEPVTVFAPINEAFFQLGGNQLDLLFSPQNADILQRLGRLHVAPGRLRLDAAEGTLTVPSLDGYALTLEAHGGALTVNGVPVFTQPIETTTGVLYLLGGVVLDGLTLEQRLRGSPALRTFAEWALDHPDLAERLRGPEPLTVFAPTNNALANIPAHVRTALRTAANFPLYRRVVAVHLVPGALPSEALTGGAALASVEGTALDVTRDGGVLRVDGRTVTQTDLRARNGVLHVLDGWIPPDVDAFDGAILRGAPTFAAAARQAGLEPLLRGAGPLSVIAFTDEAAAAVPNLFTRGDLPRIVRFHVVEGLLPSPLTVGLSFTPLEGPARTVTDFIAAPGPAGGFVLDSLYGGFNELQPLTNGRLYTVGSIHIPPP